MAKKIKGLDLDTRLKLWEEGVNDVTSRVATRQLLGITYDAARDNVSFEDFWTKVENVGNDIDNKNGVIGDE